jgi:hypothetical protein
VWWDDGDSGRPTTRERPQRARSRSQAPDAVELLI